MKSIHFLKITRDMGYWSNYYRLYYGDNPHDKKIVMSKGMYGQLIFYAYGSSMGSYRTLEGALKHINYPVSSKRLYL